MSKEPYASIREVKPSAEKPRNARAVFVLRVVLLVGGVLMLPLAVGSVLHDLRHDRPINLWLIVMALNTLNIGSMGFGHRKRRLEITEKPRISRAGLVFFVGGVLMLPLAGAGILSDFRHGRSISLEPIFLALGIGSMGLGAKERGLDTSGVEDLKGPWMIVGLTLLGVAALLVLLGQ